MAYQVEIENALYKIEGYYLPRPHENIEASNWDREVKNDIAARVEEISALILTKTKTPALCGTDTECAKLERTIQ